MLPHPAVKLVCEPDDSEPPLSILTHVRSLNSGVANMTVDENGGFVPASGQVPAGHLPPGITPQQYAQQNPYLLRSNSYQ